MHRNYPSLKPVKMIIRIGVCACLLALGGCDAVQTQALKVWMASNENLAVGDGPVVYQAGDERVSLQAVVEDLEFPWDIAFLNERQFLVTEKPGVLSRIDLDSAARSVIEGAPEVAFKGQGGLLGVALHPNFTSNHWLYLSYSAEVESGLYTTRLMRARLENNALQDQEVLFTAQPALVSTKHYGGALVFDGDGFLYLSVGERGTRQNAQDLSNHLGKILRFRDDGKIPRDNPFVGRETARPEIFSFGHRNPQGLAIHPQTGDLWEAEHGPQGGDEVNLIQAGLNYGWPVITYGEEYGGGKIGKGGASEGLQQPRHYYLPSIGTSGLDFYSGERIPAWRNNLFVGGLVYSETQLSRLVLDGNRVADSEALFTQLKMRIRNVESGPDGRLYVVAENGIIFAVSEVGENPSR
jgi:glucose/arabinose dehydrogenase